MWMGIKATNLESVKWANSIDHHSGQMVFKFATGCHDIIGIENSGNDADPLRAGSEDFMNVTEVDSANGKPGDRHVRGGPPDVLKSDRFGARLRAGGIDGTDGDVMRARGDGFARLFRRVGA